MSDGRVVSTDAYRSMWALATIGLAEESVAPRDDAAMVRELLRGGDDDLYAALVDRHKLQVLRVCAAVLGPGHDLEAEEMAQEAFLLAYRKLSTFRGECSFATWIVRLARNLAIDRSRRADHRRPHVSDSVLDGHPSSASSADPEREAILSQRRRIVHEAMNSLPHPQRMVIYLFYWTACPVTEIAELLELKRETVKSHLHRSRLRLANALEEWKTHV